MPRRQKVEVSSIEACNKSTPNSNIQASGKDNCDPNDKPSIQSVDKA